MNKTLVCCVKDCPNTSKNSQVKFFEFPGSTFRFIQWSRWIEAVRRRNGSTWRPSESSRVCAKHFFSGAPNPDSKNEDYVPMIAPLAYPKDQSVTCRSVSLKSFALEYIKHEALHKKPTCDNRNNMLRRRAYFLVARALRVSVPMVHTWELRFRHYFENKMISLARGGPGNVCAGPAWLRAVEDKLRVLGPLSEKPPRKVLRPNSAPVAPRHPVSPGMVVNMLCTASQTRGVLCSSALYNDVRRVLKISKCGINSLHAVWVAAQKISLEQVQYATRAGDARSSAAPSDAARVADLVLLYTDTDSHRLVDDESVIRNEESQALYLLWLLVRRHHLEVKPDALGKNDPSGPDGEGEDKRQRHANRWARAHKAYQDTGRVVSLLVLQRRWYELKLQARQRFAAHWRRPHADAVPDKPDTVSDAVSYTVPRPASIHLSILKHYPHIATSALPGWGELVKNGHIVIDSQVIEADLLDIEEKGLSVDLVAEDFSGDSTLVSPGGKDPPGDTPVEKANNTSDEDVDRDFESLDTSPAKKPKLDETVDSTNSDGSLSANTARQIKQEQIKHSDTDNTNMTHDVSDRVQLPTIEELHQIDPNQVKTEILFDSDSDENEFNTNENKNDISENLESIQNRILFEHGLSSPSCAKTDTSDEKDTKLVHDDDQNESAIDPKLLMNSCVHLMRVDETPFWKQYSTKNKTINLTKINIENLISRTNVNILDIVAQNSNVIKAYWNIKREILNDNTDKEEIPKKITRTHINEDELDNRLSCELTESSHEGHVPSAVECDARSAALGGQPRVTKRIQLPSIDEVRRVNSHIPTAQVAPITASLNDSQAQPTLLDEVMERSEILPTKEELGTALDEIAVTSSTAILDERHCCLWRRHRLVNDAMRHVGLKPIPIHTHGAEECDCCCFRARDSSLRTRLKAQLTKLHADITEILSGIDDMTNKEASIKKYKDKKNELDPSATPATSVKPGKKSSEQGVTLERSAADKHTLNNSLAKQSSQKMPPRPCKSKPQVKPGPKSKRIKNKPAMNSSVSKDGSPTTSNSETATNADGYEEWLRQKSMNAQYFRLTGITPNTDKESKTSKTRATPAATKTSSKQGPEGLARESSCKSSRYDNARPCLYTDDVEGTLTTDVNLPRIVSTSSLSKPDAQNVGVPFRVTSGPTSTITPPQTNSILLKNLQKIREFISQEAVTDLVKNREKPNPSHNNLITAKDIPTNILTVSPMDLMKPVNVAQTNIITVVPASARKSLLQHEPLTGFTIPAVIPSPLTTAPPNTALNVIIPATSVPLSPSVIVPQPIGSPSSVAIPPSLSVILPKPIASLSSTPVPPSPSVILPKPKAFSSSPPTPPSPSVYPKPIASSSSTPLIINSPDLNLQSTNKSILQQMVDVLSTEDSPPVVSNTSSNTTMVAGRKVNVRAVIKKVNKLSNISRKASTAVVPAETVDLTSDNEMDAVDPLALSPRSRETNLTSVATESTVEQPETRDEGQTSMIVRNTSRKLVHVLPHRNMVTNRKLDSLIRMSTTDNGIYTFKADAKTAEPSKLLKCGSTVLCVDAAKTPLIVGASPGDHASGYLVLTDNGVTCSSPTYWTVTSYDRVVRLVPPTDAAGEGEEEEEEEEPDQSCSCLSSLAKKKHVPSYRMLMSVKSARFCQMLAALEEALYLLHVRTGACVPATLRRLSGRRYAMDADANASVPAHVAAEVDALLNASVGRTEPDPIPPRCTPRNS